MNIALVLGTAREGRESEQVFAYLQRVFRERTDVELRTVDVRDHFRDAVTVPPWGEGGTETVPTEWQRIAASVDTFIFVLPEYNHGYPGEWKLLADSLYDEYAGKHAYIVGVSNGTFAGVRVADHVKPILVELGLVPHKTALYAGNVDTLFDDTGEPTDDAFSKRVEKFVDAVIKTQ